MGILRCFGIYRKPKIKILTSTWILNIFLGYLPSIWEPVETWLNAVFGPQALVRLKTLCIWCGKGERIEQLKSRATQCVITVTHFILIIVGTMAIGYQRGLWRTCSFPTQATKK